MTFMVNRTGSSTSGCEETGSKDDSSNTRKAAAVTYRVENGVEIEVKGHTQFPENYPDR
jgi:hypothetical protein